MTLKTKEWISKGETKFDLKWPQKWVFWKNDVRSFILRYNLTSFDKNQNLTFFDLHPKFMTVSDHWWPQKWFIWKMTSKGLIWDIIWLFFIKIKIWTFFTLFWNFCRQVTLNDLELIFWKAEVKSVIFKYHFAYFSSKLKFGDYYTCIKMTHDQPTHVYYIEIILTTYYNFEKFQFWMISQ